MLFDLVNLTANANIYVKGIDFNSYVSRSESRNSEASGLTTRFFELTLKGLSNNNQSGSVIIFSKGKTQIANISEYQSTPSTINGYFYTEGTMELYGFGSNLKIEGGVSANNLVLNALRGNSHRLSTGCYSNYNYQTICNNGYTYGFELYENQNSENTRLRIEYDQDILETYSKNQSGLFSSIKEEDLIKEVKLLDRYY